MENKLGLKLDQRVLIEGHEIPKKYSVAVFKGYYPGNDNPYLVEIQKKAFSGKKIGSYLMGVEEGDIKDLKYKPYTEPKIEWIFNEQEIKFKYNENTYKIYAISKNGVYVGNDFFIPFKNLCRDYTLLDGTPFGEMVK